MAANLSESQAQAQIFQWAEWMTGRLPELRLLYHVPNGGKRDARTGAMLKREGVKAGVPDLVLPVARGGYHGLYVELKVGKNRPTQLQWHWIQALLDQGYYACVCWGTDQVESVIMAYLRGEINHGLN